MPQPTVFITGAAAGIGRATALTFAGAGFHVGAYDIDETGLASLAKEVVAKGAQVTTGVLNVTDLDQFAERLAEFDAAAGGRLDVLINNAGVLAAGAFEEMPIAVHRRQMDINVGGVINGCLAAFPYLRKTKGAQVVNMCSASAIYGQSELATYSASKFAVRGLTEALDIEWKKYNIRVLAMWPLFVQSAMTEGVSTGTTNSLGINLVPQDVADDIFAATQDRSVFTTKVLNKVHFPVGRPAKVLALGSRFSPAWLTRRVNKRLAH